MEVFVVRLNPDTRNCVHYSKYPTLQEYKSIHESSPMNGFHEAVNFLSEKGVVRGYLPPKHSRAMRTGELFVLVTITAKTAKINGDMVVGIQAGCKYEGENKRTAGTRDSKSLGLLWHYYCQESLSLLLNIPIHGARSLVLGEVGVWARVPTLQINQSILNNIINEIPKKMLSPNDRNKLNKIIECVSAGIIQDRPELESESTFDLDVIDALGKKLDNIAGNKYPTQKEVKSFQYIRSPLVVAYALKKANGICGGCGKKAPFVSKNDGLPYLEVHHIKMLKDGGSDTIDNVITLCPNCHRERHYG